MKILRFLEQLFYITLVLSSHAVMIVFFGTHDPLVQVNICFKPHLAPNRHFFVLFCENSARKTDTKTKNLGEYREKKQLSQKSTDLTILTVMLWVRTELNLSRKTLEVVSNTIETFFTSCNCKIVNDQTPCWIEFIYCNVTWYNVGFALREEERILQQWQLTLSMLLHSIWHFSKKPIN